MAYDVRMSPGWTLFLEVLGALASVVVILDYLGIKPNAAAWGSIMALNQKWKLVIMLGLVGLMLWFSGYGFYRSLRPKIVEKTVTVTVEKPVDRIVEKVVKVDCSKKSQSPVKDNRAAKETPDNSVHLDNGSKIEQQSNGDCSPNMIGGSGTVNCAPPLKLMTTQVIEPSDQDGFLKTVITVVPNKDVTAPFNVVLRFDIPVKSIGVSISGSGGISGGGPGAVSSGTNLVIPLGTGFNPKHALLLTMYSASPLKLLDIHLE